MMSKQSNIKPCPDCIQHMCSQRSDWFSDVCRPPHTLIWAHVPDYPYWPAKALHLNDERTMVAVLFFGEHSPGWVSVNKCFLFSIRPPFQPSTNWTGYALSMIEVDSYIHKYFVFMNELTFPNGLHLCPVNDAIVRAAVMRQTSLYNAATNQGGLVGSTVNDGTVRAGLLIQEPALSMYNATEPLQVGNVRGDGSYVASTPTTQGQHTPGNRTVPYYRKGIATPASTSSTAVNEHSFVPTMESNQNTFNIEPTSLRNTSTISESPVQHSNQRNKKNSTVKRPHAELSSANVINMGAPSDRNNVQSNRAATVTTIESNTLAHFRNEILPVEPNARSGKNKLEYKWNTKVKKIHPSPFTAQPLPNNCILCEPPTNSSSFALTGGVVNSYSENPNIYQPLPYAAHRGHNISKNMNVQPMDNAQNTLNCTVCAGAYSQEPSLPIYNEPAQGVKIRNDLFYSEGFSAFTPYTAVGDRTLSSRTSIISESPIAQKTKLDSVPGNDMRVNNRISTIEQAHTSSTHVINAEAPSERNTVQFNQAATAAQHNARGDQYALTIVGDDLGFPQLSENLQDVLVINSLTSNNQTDHTLSSSTSIISPIVVLQHMNTPICQNTQIVPGNDQHVNNRTINIEQVHTPSTLVINPEVPSERNTVQFNQAATVAQDNAATPNATSASSTNPQISQFDVLLLAAEHIRNKNVR